MPQGTRSRPGCVSAMPAGVRSRSDRRTPTDWWRTRRGERSVPGVQREKRSTPSAEPESSGRSDQPQPPDRCPTCEAINSNAPDGCPAGEGPTSTPTRRTGPRTESYVKSAGSIRAACEGPTSNSASAAFPLGRLYGHARATGRSRTQVSMAGNLGESQTVKSLSPRTTPQERAGETPFRNCRRIVHKS